MAFGKFLAALMGLLYLYFVVEAVTSHVRSGWLFNPVKSGRQLLYKLTVGHDFFAMLIFFWLTAFQISNLIGRTIMLWLAHWSITAVMIGKFESTSDEGELQQWGCVGKPICLLLGCYWYYLVFQGDVSLVDIWDWIEAFLDA
ncbi:MAG: hypothetical protein AB1403_21645 [Candidatus Riflebacteria bacterium]